MTAGALLRAGSIGLSVRNGRKPSTILAAARHNLREAQQERGGRAHIDPARSPLNMILVGPASARGVQDRANELMACAGIDSDKLRKDYTQAVELLVSLSAGAACGGFFGVCVEWAGERYGRDNILSAVVHHDEGAPHCHILILPLVAGKMAGSALLARKEIGELQASFKELARAHGFKVESGRLDAAQRTGLARAVLACANATNDVALRSCMWQAIRDAIERDPQPFAAAFGVGSQDQPVKPKKMRTTAQIFTSPGKGPRRERELQKQNLGFHSMRGWKNRREKSETYLV